MGEKIMTGFPTREEALKDFFDAWRFKPVQELVSLQDCCGRVLACDITSAYDLPVVRASQCDGVAVRSVDFKDGIPDTSQWRLGADYVRADTGDDFPDEFDAVVMIEKAALQPDGSVVFDEDVSVQPNTNVSSAGSTIAKGSLVLKAPHIIRPTDIAALCLAGATMVPVVKKPVVAFIPTGNELVPAGAAPQRGQMIECNSIMVEQMLIQYGAKPLVFPIVRDDPNALATAFEQAIAQADFVVINGGSALGDEDRNVVMLEQRGKVIHHYIAAAPGRPLMMAVVDDKPVIDLPGPTIGAFYGATWCLQAVIACMLGVAMCKPQTVEAISQSDYRTHPAMAMLGRWNVARNAEGVLEARVCNFRNGGLADALTSNAMRVSPVGEEHVSPGDSIQLELLGGEELIL